jgi:hypothetical protein
LHYRFFGNSRTERGRQNGEYAHVAAVALHALRREFPEVVELVGDEPSALGRRRRDIDRELCARNLGVLAELGRIVDAFEEGDRHAARLALEVLAMRPRPNSKAAVAILRRWRLDQLGVPEPAGDARGLALAIFRAIDGYLSRKPATPRGAVVEALGCVLRFHLEPKTGG